MTAPAEKPATRPLELPLFAEPGSPDRALLPSPSPSIDPSLARLEGAVRRVVYASPDGEFAVLELDVEGASLPAVIVGQLAAMKLGETLQVAGRWERHPQFGRQLRVELALPKGPQTLLGIERYLATLSGIGPELSRRIVETFGLSALTVLETETFRVAAVKGIGKRRAQRALADVQARHEEREVMIFLQGLGVSVAYAARIRKRYGRSAIAKVREDPYTLGRDVAGIGFHIADRIARAVGIPADSPRRIEAALRHTLDSALDIGHCYLPEAELVQRTTALLSVEPGAQPGEGGPPIVIPPHAIAASLDELLHRAEAICEEGCVYSARVFALEVALAREVQRLAAGQRRRVPRIETASLPFALAPLQEQALLAVETAPLSILTGGPGTGKTTIVRALVSACRTAGLDVRLVAPTGRAAKRLSEATSASASTVHRLLELRPGEAEPVRRTQLEADVIVCDEASMLDVGLALALLSAIKSGSTFVLVGDVDQLPSVGPGRVLADIIDSGRVPVTRLVDIFRQAEGSGIVENAHRILAGQVPISAPRGSETGDFYIIEATEPAQARDVVVRLVRERIPQRFGFDPLVDIQVLSPMHRGEVGTEELNRVLQLELQPILHKPESEIRALRSRGRRFVIGDKVMQVRNDYDRDVWNGDVGLVSSMDLEEGLLTVRYDDEREVVYDEDALDQLELAYAMSVHKSQGSEYKAVVVPLLMQHYPLLRRNLLYTAVTRGKKLAVLVGEPRALRRAVREAGDLQRYTRLAARLRGILPN
jgi:exodeoxyribonuclease V alpha subunit